MRRRTTSAQAPSATCQAVTLSEDYDADKVNVLLKGVSSFGESVCGWAREYGRGRVCALANGNNRDVFMHPQFQRLMQNAVRWCLKMRVPGAR